MATVAFFRTQCSRLCCAVAKGCNHDDDEVEVDDDNEADDDDAVVVAV